MLYTDNYSLKKPQYGETADVADINYNADKIDGIMWDNRRISVAMYDTSETYNTDALVGHEDSNGHIHVYKCLADNVTGTWDGTKWEMTDLASEIEDVRENVGTDVEANPSGTATDTLEKLRVDSTIYAIPEDVVSKEAEGNPIEITDGASAPLVKCVSAITGSQDLHGYDKPWVGGAGKNKFPLDGYVCTVPTGEKNAVYVTAVGVKNGVTYTLSCYQDSALASNVRNTIMLGANGTNYYETDAANPNYHNEAGWHHITFTSNSDQLIYIRYWGHTLSQETTYSHWMLEEGATASTTYSPYSNICPITAYTEGKIEVRGKNLFDKSATDTDNGYMANNYIRATGAAQSDSDCNISEYIEVAPNENYIISNVTGNNVGFCFYDKDYGYISGQGYGLQWGTFGNVAFNTPATAKYVRLSIIKSTVDTMQLEKGSTPTTYEPYTSTTHTTTYPSAIYQGNADFVNGEVTSEWGKIIFDGSADENWSMYGSGSPAAYAMQIDLSDMARRAITQTDKFIVANYLQTIPTNETWGNYDGFISRESQGTKLVTGIKSITTVEAWKTYLANNPLEVAYELATPTTETITPTNLPIKSLFGYNHIESSTGEMEIEYIAKAFSPITEIVDSQISALQKMMELMLTANREEEMKATRNYTAGELLIVSGKLYKASSNIANGSTLVINSNVTSTTIAAELAALA